MTRAELSTLCEAELGKLKAMVRGCLDDAGAAAKGLLAVQTLGGGCRMPAVQDAIGLEVRGKLWFRGGDNCCRSGDSIDGCGADLNTILGGAKFSTVRVSDCSSIVFMVAKGVYDVCRATPPLSASQSPVLALICLLTCEYEQDLSLP